MKFMLKQSNVARSFHVKLPLLTERIYIGSNLNDFIISKLAENHPRNVVVVSQSIYPQATELIHKLSDQEPIVIKSLEENKSFDFIRTLIIKCQLRMLNRDSYLIGIGGGIIGDTIGFLSSIYMRGVKFVYIPTTLLSQCDSIINKVAVSVDRIKNLVGSFYSPHFIFCDTDYLQSLSRDQISYGLVEVIKHALITNSTKLIRLLKLHLKDNLNRWEIYPWDEIIYESLRVKILIIEQDPFDRHGLQKGLNYGHTFGHSLEGLSGYKLPHGLAVAIGMSLVGYISNELNILQGTDLKIQNELLALSRLDLSLPQDFNIDMFINLLKKDKINDGTGINLVLLKKIGDYEIQYNINEALIRKIIKKYIIKKSYLNG